MAPSAAKDDTMKKPIEVFVENWQLDCCGTAFEVGSTVTWGIHADEPESTRDIPAFIEDHHGLAEESACSEVTGEVLEIVAVSNRLVSVPGSRSRTNDPSDVGEEQVEKAERFHRAPEGFSPMGFRVRLEIDAGTPLPEYVEPSWVEEQRERNLVLEAAVTAYRDSDVGRRLAQLCNRIADEFSGRVDVRSERTGVTIQPLGANRCAVMWMHSPNGISLLVGDGTWSLAGTVQGVVAMWITSPGKTIYPDARVARLRAASSTSSRLQRGVLPREANIRGANPGT
jgi:hypothetical protein